MSSILLLTPLRALLGSAFCYAVYYIYWESTTGRSRRRVIRRHGCKPAKMYPSKDPFFGLDTLWGLWKSMMEHRALESSESRFNSVGRKTSQMRLLTQDLLATIEPENIKTVL